MNEKPEKTNQLPGMGWVAAMSRWANQDVDTVGQDGPLAMAAPPTADTPSMMDYLYGGNGGMLGIIGGQLQQFFSEPQTRKDLYQLYDEMDKTDIAGSVLDLYAEDATQVDPETNRTLWVRCSDKAMVKAAEELFKRIKLEDIICDLARSTAKYGDDFERLVYRSGADGGVQRLVPVHPREVQRKADKEGKLEGYLQQNKKFRGNGSTVSYAWDYAHFRMPGNDRVYGYGTSILKNAIRPWRHMMILEDWMVGYQVSRHPDRNLFVLDIGESTEVEAQDVARRFRQKLKRHMIVDPAGTSGKSLGYDFKPIHPTEDMVLPVRKDSVTRVEKLSGSGNAADIAPLNYVVQKFTSAVRVPKGFLGFDDNAPGGMLNLKASLTAQDIRYARRVKTLQRAVKNGVQYLLELNYSLLDAGGNPERMLYDFLTDPKKAFTVHMTPVSYLDELERLELLQLRQQVGVAFIDMARDNFAFRASEWTAYILREIIKVPGDELKGVLRKAGEIAAIQNVLMRGQGGNVIASVPIQPPALDLPQAEGAVDADTQKRIDDAIADLHAKGCADGNISGREALMLSEAIKRNPRMRNLIEMGAMMWRPDAEAESMIVTSGRALPDAEALAKGPLADVLTQDDIQEMLDEVAHEHDRAGT